MMLKRKKKEVEKLKASFGKLKEDAFNFELIEKYFRGKDNSQAFHEISDKTAQDLDLHQFYMYADRTHSRVGQQFLYNKLRVFKQNSQDIDIEEEVVSRLSNDVPFRVKLQQQLSKLNNLSAYYLVSLFQDEHIAKPKWFFLLPVLSVTAVLSLAMMFIQRDFFLVFLGVFLVNLILHYWNKRNVYQYLDSIPQLIILHDTATMFYKDEQLQKLDPRLDESIRIIDSVKNRMAFFRMESRLEGDLTSAFWFLAELLKAFFLIEPLLLFSALKKLNERRREIEQVYAFVGRTDALLSIASLRYGQDVYSVPEITETENHIRVAGMYHPLVEGCVKNDLHSAEKSILLTGSNMSGKTTFIRAVGINVISGLTLHTCFAEYASIPRTKLLTYIRISDDLMNNKSYYFEEVLTIKEMIEKSASSGLNLFLLDEIYKGTNTIERISAGKAVLSFLSKNENKVFISTHDIELAEMLSDEYDLYHFSENVDSKTVGFDYKLKEGKLKNRNAIKILAINGYPASVIDEANKIAQLFDNEKNGE